MYYICVFMLSVYIVVSSQTMYYCVWGSLVAVPYSCVSCIYGEQICISGNTFSHYSYYIQENILFIVHIVKSMICRVYIVMIESMINHNAYTCTSILQYIRTYSFLKINTNDSSVHATVISNV